MCNVFTITSEEQFKKIKFKKDSVCVVDILMLNNFEFPTINKKGILFIYLDEKFYQIGIGHPDLITLDINNVLNFIFDHVDNVQSKFVFNVKKISHIDERFLKFNCIDTYTHVKHGEIVERDSTLCHNFFETRYKNKLINFIIPASKHMECFIHSVNTIDIPSVTELIEPGYRSVIRDVIPQLFNIEKNGMFINREKFNSHFSDKYIGDVQSDLVYSNYNVWSATGRPSNTNQGINFAALDKSTGERSCFTSRYGKDGILVLFDFRAYHPRLLAKLTNFNIPSTVDDVYTWLSTQILKKDILTKEEISSCKGSIFQQLYGKIEDKNLKIPYFKAIQDYMDQRWKFFLDNGYVDTPIYKRAITSNHIKGAFSNKVTNYILQAYETERNCEIMKMLSEFLKDKKTIPILYSYDSILFDFNKFDKKDTIINIKTIMESDGFPVTIKVGSDFQDMKNMQIS